MDGLWEKDVLSFLGSLDDWNTASLYFGDSTWQLQAVGSLKLSIWFKKNLRELSWPHCQTITILQYATILQHKAIPVWGREQNKDWLISPLFSRCMIARKILTSKFGKHKGRAFSKSSQHVNNMKEENSLLLFVPGAISHDLMDICNCPLP